MAEFNHQTFSCLKCLDFSISPSLFLPFYFSYTIFMLMCWPWALILYIYSFTLFHSTLKKKISTICILSNNSSINDDFVWVTTIYRNIVINQVFSSKIVINLHSFCIYHDNGDDAAAVAAMGIVCGMYFGMNGVETPINQFTKCCKFILRWSIWMQPQKVCLLNCDLFKMHFVFVFHIEMR